jgi:hypothetical protein
MHFIVGGKVALTLFKSCVLNFAFFRFNSIVARVLENTRIIVLKNQTDPLITT